ncbi:MAG: serine/threonine protein kinase [Butyrivibrio sp.]|nr:serine/threonine protein kinase [Muribaculum sp.]MCM1552845.1 serine/threonine protein kinase [Butyrivibrio sp.]
MELIAGCFGQEEQGDLTGVCKTVRKKDRVPIVLLYAVAGDAGQERAAENMRAVGEMDRVGAGRIAEFGVRVREWFYGQALKLCGKGVPERCVDKAAESFRRWMSEIESDVGAMETENGYAALFCMGEECFYAWCGEMAVCQINRGFDRYHLRKLSAASESMVCVRTALEAEVGVLLCHEEFLEGFTAEQIRECLAVGELSGQGQVERRLRELAAEARRRGIGHRATAFLLTKETGFGGRDELLEGILRRHGYAKVKLIGRGAFGHVYQVKHRRTRKRAACKVAIGVREQEVLRREAMLQGKLSHPLFARFLDWIEEDDISILIMEHVRGRDLSDLLRRGPLSARRAVRIAIQLAGGLQYLHESPEPVLYRDLKPENIRIGVGDRVKLLDLGCACPLSEAGRSLAGSRGYAAPEQLGETAGTCGFHSDIYALGRVLTAMLVGDGCGRRRYWDRALMREGALDRLEELIESCVEDNPAKRPGGMTEVVKGLADCYKRNLLQKVIL